MTKFLVTLKHEQHGEQKTVVEHDAADSFHDHWEEICKAARKNIASRYVSYENFKSDSAYADRLEKFGHDKWIIQEIRLDSKQPLMRYFVGGRYPSREGGTWADHVFATTAEEAEFLARQIMAVNDYGGKENADEVRDDDFQLTMEEIDIDDLYPEPVTRDEALKALHHLYESCRRRAGKPDAKTMLVTRELLEGAGLLRKPAKTPTGRTGRDKRARRRSRALARAAR